MSFLTETAINLLKLVKEGMPHLYELIEADTQYPNRDDFKNDLDYDRAVDEAELITLCRILLGNAGMEKFVRTVLPLLLQQRIMKG